MVMAMTSATSATSATIATAGTCRGRLRSAAAATDLAGEATERTLGRADEAALDRAADAAGQALRRALQRALNRALADGAHAAFDVLEIIEVDGLHD
jgi:hypothetical protein